MTLNIVQNWQRSLLVAILFFVVIFSFSNLTTRPKVWFDEGLNVEIAHNFILFRKLDILTAPDAFSGAPYIVGTNGYPLTIPLGVVFYIFGFGLTQTRIFMLVWIIVALLSIYFVVRRFFGIKNALATTAFVATFAPFYGNGLTALGEVPGFVFLIWGLFFLFEPEQKNYWLTGLFFGLSSVVKPSLYLLLFPSFLIYLFLEERKEFFKKLFKFGVGAIPPMFLWFILAFPEPFFLKTWQGALWFYRYPFGGEFSILIS